MAPWLAIQRVELTNPKTISIEYRHKSASAAVMGILWSIGNIKSLSEEDQKHESVILTAEYENGEAAEDAMAEFAAFTPDAKKNLRPTPWSDRVRSRANFELIRVQIDP